MKKILLLALSLTLFTACSDNKLTSYFKSLIPEDITIPFFEETETETGTATEDSTKVEGEPVSEKEVFAIHYTTSDGRALDIAHMEFGEANIVDNEFTPQNDQGRIIFDKAITTIKENTFSGCRNLYSVTIPSSVTSIEPFAFKECPELVEVTIIQEAEETFYNHSDYKGLYTYGSNRMIKEKAFFGCSKLQRIMCKKEFEGSNTAFDTLAPAYINELNAAPFSFFGCNNLGKEYDLLVYGHKENVSINNKPMIIDIISNEEIVIDFMDNETTKKATVSIQHSLSDMENLMKYYLASKNDHDDFEIVIRTDNNSNQINDRNYQKYLQELRYEAYLKVSETIFRTIENTLNGISMKYFEKPYIECTEGEAEIIGKCYSAKIFTNPAKQTPSLEKTEKTVVTTYVKEEKAKEELSNTQTVITGVEVSETSVADENEVLDVVEIRPEFPGGTQALYNWLGRNIVYPRISRENNSQGKSFVRFIVNTDGSIENIKVIRSSGDTYLDREAVRVISAMPRWTPGRMGGKNVRTWYTIPVVFRLQ